MSSNSYSVKLIKPQTVIISTLVSTWRSLRPSLGLIWPIELSLSSFSFSSFFLNFCHPPSQLPPPSPASSRLDSCSPPLSQAQLSPCPSLSFISGTFRAPLHLSPLRRHFSPLSSASRLYIPSSHTNGPVVLLIFQPFFSTFYPTPFSQPVFYTFTPSKHSFIKFPRRAVNKRWCVYVILAQLFKNGATFKESLRVMNRVDARFDFLLVLGRGGLLWFLWCSCLQKKKKNPKKHPALPKLQPWFLSEGSLFCFFCLPSHPHRQIYQITFIILFQCKLLVSVSFLYFNVRLCF